MRGLYPLSERTFTAKSREVSKPRDSGLDFFNRSEMWQAPRQERRRDACQISERNDLYDFQSRDFETSRDLVVRRLTASWIGRGIKNTKTQSLFRVICLKWLWVVSFCCKYCFNALAVYRLLTLLFTPCQHGIMGVLDVEYKRSYCWKRSFIQCTFQKVLINVMTHKRVCVCEYVLFVK